VAVSNEYAEEMMRIFVLVQGKAIAAIEAGDVEEARNALVPAVEAENRELFYAHKARWDETLPMTAREASPEEAVEYRRRAQTDQPIVWMFDTDASALESTPSIMVDDARQAIIRVSDGRGFIVETERERLVGTAAHCLPHLPPPHPWAYAHEVTYGALLGPLGQEPTVWAQCIFADPIADVAVLSAPGHVDLCEQADAFEELVTTRPALKIADAPAPGRKLITPSATRATVWTSETAKGQEVEITPAPFEVETPGRGDIHLLSLDGEWIEAQVEHRCNWLSIEPKELVRSGMSGSPIMLAGAAIGLVSNESKSPVLIDSLPTWLVRALLKDRR
jgi:hypothetical protein